MPPCAARGKAERSSWRNRRPHPRLPSKLFWEADQPFGRLATLITKQPALEEHQLISEFINTRSEAAFLALYRSRTPALYQTALRITQDAAWSEELIQETWITAIRGITSFRRESRLHTWLTGILINTYRNTRRKKEREAWLEEQPSAEYLLPYTVQPQESPDLEQAIAALPPGYRQIVVLHDIEGYTHKEIATLLDIAEGTSKSQLFHARKTLREHLNDKTD